MTPGVVFLGGMALGAWLFLVFARRRFWRTGERLGEPPAPAHWPAVAVVVPARDEAATVDATLQSLSRQDYPGNFRIILVDDHSSDGTAEIAADAAADAPRPIEIIRSPDLAAGWTGKLWALHAGLSHAVRVQPETEFYWFTDADIVHGPGVLRRLAAKAAAEDRDIVSLMVRLRCHGFWEALLIPAFVYFFQKLYPFAAVNDPESAVAGAAGGCLLIRRPALERAGGLPAIRGALIDDCALAAAVKRLGGRLWLGLAEDSHSLRAYPRLRDLWEMVARTAFAQLRFSPLRLVVTVLGMTLVYLLPPLLVITAPLHRDLSGVALGAAAWGLMALSYVPTLAYYGGARLRALTLPAAAALYTAMTVSSALRHWRGRGGEWKARRYGANAA